MLVLQYERPALSRCASRASEQWTQHQQASKRTPGPLCLGHAATPISSDLTCEL